MNTKKTILVAASLAAAAGVIYFVAPLRLAAIVLAGRSPVCPMANALRAEENLRTQIAYKDEILRASKKLETDPAGYHLWDTPDGRYWIPEGSDYVLPFNLAEQKRQIYGTGEQAVQAGDVVLDCGANVGVFTRNALRAGAKLVVAIEPAPENIECLRRNFVREIAAGRVILYEKGVWDKDDVLTLQVDPHNSAADSFLIHREGGVEGKKVPLTTIDKLVAELKIEKVGYIKMDIEGAEQRALAGARATLAKDHPRLSLSAYHNDEDPVKVPEAVMRGWSGYSMECGPCAETRFRVRPDILYFR
ncbi:MAG: FkbM family methyltransferase [Bryobacterales bacterium]|nr:FkbM family methyltransferase [Bryobacterales bacterium]